MYDIKSFYKILILLIVYVSLVNADTLTLNSGDVEGDSYVYKSSGNTNYGSDQDIILAWNNTAVDFERRIYMNWSIADIIATESESVSSARLSLYINNNLLGGTSYGEIWLYDRTWTWDEGVITWNNQPSASKRVMSCGWLNVTEAYGDSKYANSSDIGDCLQYALDNSWVDFTIMLIDMHSPTSGGDNRIEYNSKDASSNKPLIYVDYAPMPCIPPVADSSWIINLSQNCVFSDYDIGVTSITFNGVGGVTFVNSNVTFTSFNMETNITWVAPFRWVWIP